MKKIIAISFIIAGAIISCEKEDLQPNSNNSNSMCSCYETHETNETYINSNGTVSMAWKFKYNTTPQPDMCSKATGEWVYSGNTNQFRYKVYCK